MKNIMVKIKTKENELDKQVEFINSITDLAEIISPIFQKTQEINAPIIKRSQLINFTIMMTLCISISLLAYSQVVDGSAATGLLGAIIGYVFGHTYSNKDKR